MYGSKSPDQFQRNKLTCDWLTLQMPARFRRYETRTVVMYEHPCHQESLWLTCINFNLGMDKYLDAQ